MRSSCPAPVSAVRLRSGSNGGSWGTTRPLARHPEALRWASMRTAPFRDGAFTLYNSNSLIGKYKGLDGLKTGYHYRAGFCLAATAVRDGRRLVAVVMGVGVVAVM